MLCLQQKSNNNKKDCSGTPCPILTKSFKGNTVNIVILAGGFGERLWPASSPNYPKQFLKLDNGLSFLQQSLERAFFLTKERKCATPCILLITRKAIFETCVTQVHEYAKILENNNKNDSSNFLEKILIIAEPEQKHTAPPLAFASRFFESHNNNDPMLVLTADHIIEPLAHFKNDIQKACEVAKENKFICFAIKPTTPEIGFGYIEEQKNSDLNGVFKIAQFKEKPNLETAKLYLKKGNYWWNSGMFCVTPTAFLQELKTHAPDIYNAFPPSNPIEYKSTSLLDKANYMQNAYNKTIAESIDVAVAEKTINAFAIKTTFNWKDIGNWDSFSELFQNTSKKQNNITEIESENCFVYSDLPVALCGVNDLIISIKNGKVLVVKKGKSALVKKIPHNKK